MTNPTNFTLQFVHHIDAIDFTCLSEEFEQFLESPECTVLENVRVGGITFISFLANEADIPAEICVDNLFELNRVPAESVG